MLPIFLLLLALGPLPSFGQQRQYELPSLTTEKLPILVPALTRTLPTSTSPYNVTITLCNLSSPIPRFFLSNDSSNTTPGPGKGGTEITFIKGLGKWNGTANEGGTLVIYTAVNVTGPPTWTFQIGITTKEALHRADPLPPLLGDTTATQAIVFSRPFLPPPNSESTYPNYTLPIANLSTASPPSQTMNNSLVIFDTSADSGTFEPLLNSACGLSAAFSNFNVSGRVINASLTLRDDDGWRTQWIIEGLRPATNYTVFVAENSRIVSGPLYFLTKSAAFPCPLVHDVPFCPSVSYAVPLPTPPDGATTYTNNNLPSNLTGPIFSYLTNFTTSLLTFGCGRDMYSPVQTCGTCQAAYRAWLCSVTFPRCGESAVVSKDYPIPALASYGPTDPTRSANIAPLGQDWKELLPCVESCFAVGRSCPPFLGWTCPGYDVNANESYGIDYLDSMDGYEGRGRTGIAQDRYGHIWCNLV